MKRLRHVLAAAGIASALCLGAGHVGAQPPGGGNGPGGPGGPGGGQGGFGGGNFDPAQFQQMMMDNYREQLEVTDDAEWNILQERVQKVMDARQAAGGGGRGMFGMRGRGGPGGPGGNNGPGGNGQGGGRRGGFGGQPNPEAEALQAAIDDKASPEQLKAVVAKYVEARKQKQAALEKAQADLRALLSTRQEAIAYSIGLL